MQSELCRLFSTTQRTKSEVLIDFLFLKDVEGNLDKDGQPNLPTEHYCSHFFCCIPC